MIRRYERRNDIRNTLLLGSRDGADSGSLADASFKSLRDL